MKGYTIYLEEKIKTLIYGDKTAEKIYITRQFNHVRETQPATHLTDIAAMVGSVEILVASLK
jgi:hypothetical protein